MTTTSIICKRCVLSTDDNPYITFDEQGICSHCIDYQKKITEYPVDEETRRKELNAIISKIKVYGRNRKYDCILGISGGVDSSFLAYKAKEFGLNTLLVHFDNGWNSSLAVQNIERIINYTGFDLFTYVVDWEEFKDLQLSYIRASVLDWEIPTDHGFFAMLYDQAYKQRIKYILSGHNVVTEGILPKVMRWSKLDVANIKDIHAHYGTKKLKTFPLLGFFKYNYYLRIKGLNLVTPLNYMDYNKDEAIKTISKEMGWKNYGGKHYESIFTRFYQGYVLLKKFGYDKRTAHLSTLINSGQMTRDEALKELKNPSYDAEQYRIDREFVIKKLDMTEAEFKKMMGEPVRSHEDFKSYETGLYRKHERFMQKIAPATKLLKKILRS